MLSIRKDTSRLFKLVKSPMEPRIRPKSMLLVSVKMNNRLKFPMLEGRDSMSQLESNYREVKLYIFPMDSGIRLVSRFPERDRDYKPYR